ncbi:MAG: DUF2927 domain-containing protein [Pseudorhodobacter sp.]
MRLAPLLTIGLLSACMPSPGADVSMGGARPAIPELLETPSEITRFGLAPGKQPDRSNTEIARDFLGLTFELESGRKLPRFSRFEGPVTLRLQGQVPSAAATDLSRLLQRLRSEAGIDIRETNSENASITIEFVPRRAIRTTYANVACFVEPRIGSWEEFRTARHTGKLDWTTLGERKRIAIFLPSDAPPQEIRDCLHEELAQSLGPLNDLYQLTDSVFNDDNFHTSLTGYDMLILQAYYAPELQSGMSRDQVASRLPAILARINPAGGQVSAIAAPEQTSQLWVNRIRLALGDQGNAEERLSAAKQALAQARATGWRDGRLAFSYFALGRQALGNNPGTALDALRTAAQIYRGLPGGSVPAAHADMQIAAYALMHDDARSAYDIATRITPIASKTENAALMATLLLLRAEAAEMLGRSDEAQALRMDSRGWARYGFGSDRLVTERIKEIAALAQRGRG